MISSTAVIVAVRVCAVVCCCAGGLGTFFTFKTDFRVVCVAASITSLVAAAIGVLIAYFSAAYVD